ncbi:MAG: potassium-transporting ATPase subunit C [Phycisphaerales bacterium]
MLSELLASLRITIASILICVVVYTTAVMGSAMLIAPESRLGSLITLDGRLVGSRHVAQAFSRPEYFWPRPSAVNYAADATGGSNLSPSSPVIRVRAEALLRPLNATLDNPAPAELVLASGSGIDPHITEAAALYQADRVASARRASTEPIRDLISLRARPIGPGDQTRIVNVLLLNIELDQRFPTPNSRQ